MIPIETGLVLVALVIALTYPKLGAHRFESWEKAFLALSRRRTLSVVLVGFAAVVARISLLPLLPIPDPGIPDEFGHLLAADTFAHFRLTNPVHPMWVHFENLSEIQQPSYASKYPPAQGLILAIGQIVFGHPFWGVCLSIGLMCAAICWMLQAWLPPQWALLGGFLALIRLGMFSYWASSYWGGSVAALGGALVLGALPRIKATVRPHHALIMGIGLAILANSRPYEGLVFAFPAMLAAAVWLARLNRNARNQALRRVAIPLLACVIVTVYATAYYCWRVTGNALRMPYQVAQETYYPTPLFLWQPLRQLPPNRHREIQSDLQHWELPVYEGGRQHPLLMAEARVFFFALFFLGPGFSMPFLILPYVLPYGFSWKHLSSDTQLLVIIFVVSVVALLLPLFFNPGYAAPLTAVVYVLLLKALRRVRSLRVSQNDTGVAFSRCLILACVVLIFIRAAAQPLHIQLYGPRSWSSLDFQLTERARLRAQLLQKSGRDLIIVHYHEFNLRRGTEWVFNDADIDGSRVVWARDMGQEGNSQLIKYFKDRKVWLLEPDEVPPKLSRYSD